MYLAFQSRPSCFLTFWPYKAGLPCFSEFPDLFSILFGALRPLPKSGLYPNNFLNHHRVPCHPYCSFKLLLSWPHQSSDKIHAQNAMKSLTSHSAVLAASNKPYNRSPNLSCSELGVWSEEGSRLAYSHLRTNYSLIVGRKRRKKRNESQQSMMTDSMLPNKWEDNRI